jgi:iron complex outermembrane receptor protein
VIGAFYLNSRDRLFPQFLQSQAAILGFDTTVVEGIQKTKSYAAYGQGTYEVVDDTNLTLGFRYTIDKRNLFGATNVTIGGVTNPAFAPFRDSTTFKKPTWRIALDHRFSPDVMVYGSYSRGFKSGVYNLTAPTDPVVNPEQLDAFEVGFKSSLLDRRIRLNGAAFYYKYKDIQLTKIVGAAQSLVNAAAATVYGVEFDAEAAVSDQFTIRAGMELLHPEYEKFLNAPVSTVNTVFPFGNAVFPGDLGGFQMIAAPRFTANVAFDYRIPIGESELGANVTYLYRAHSPFEPDGRLQQPSTHLVNAQLMWTAPGERYHVKVWGRNLLKEKYYLQQTAVFLGDLATAAPGRTYGVALGLKL